MMNLKKTLHTLNHAVIRIISWYIFTYIILDILKVKKINDISSYVNFFPLIQKGDHR